ncbi:MAG: DUF3991 and toprim domain-containing protein, partial [Oscillospiraceae bacterium]|nr:DUF3991 and toprim domain-containing protein [Oscillospiraceae bacterium]
MNQKLIEQARSADLVSYFRSSGYTLEEREHDEVYIKEFPGLCIHQSGQWYAHYSGFGGGNAVNCLVEVLGFDFSTAVEELTDDRKSCKPEKKREDRLVTMSAHQQLIMPECANNEKRVIAYLCKKRLIPYAVITEFIEKGKLYQCAEHGNAVFPHVLNGEIVGAEIHGTTDTRFKKMAKGTHFSYFAFRCTPKIEKAYIFESAIDLMSYYTITDPSNLNATALLSLAGLKPRVLCEILKTGVFVRSCLDNTKEAHEFEQ